MLHKFKFKKRYHIPKSIRSKGLILSKCSLIINVIVDAEESLSKSDLIDVVGGLYWQGYASSYFMYHNMLIKRAFEELVADGTIIYVKGKKVRMNEE